MSREPFANERAPAVDDDGAEALALEIDDVSERGVVTAEGGAADLGDDDLAHVV
jgi:hypothetical protein